MVECLGIACPVRQVLEAIATNAGFPPTPAQKQEFEKACARAGGGAVQQPADVGERGRIACSELGRLANVMGPVRPQESEGDE